MPDLTPTAANVKAGTGAVVQQATAGATITAGQSIYLDASNSNKAKLADNNVTDAEAACVGVAINDSADGKPINYVNEGILLGMGATEGVIYVVSAAAGGVFTGTLLAGNRVRIIGVGRSDGGIDMKIHNPASNPQQQ